METPNWIAVDWGKSRLRAWAMSAAGEVLALAESAQCISTLAPEDYELVLLALVEPWLPEEGSVTVVACGMVGARQGWIEVPYVAAPCRPGVELTRVPVSSERIEVGICRGVKQAPLSPDVMRGEETLIAGLLSGQPDFSGVVCLPGTHSKWVLVDGGKIDAFQTFLTGELFALLAEQSVLRHTVASEGWDQDAFYEAQTIGFDAPTSVSAKLFSLRSEALLESLEGATARARLSGYLIGMELAGAHSFWQHSEVAIIGDQELAEIYRSALRTRGVEPVIHDVETMILAGLKAAHDHWAG